MTDHSGAPTHIQKLAHRCLACEISTHHDFRDMGSDHPHLLEIAARIMRDPGYGGHAGRDKAMRDDAFKMAWAVYRFLHPEMRKLCDVAAQHALETPDYFLSTEVRDKLIAKIFPDDSPQYNPARHPGK